MLALKFFLLVFTAVCARVVSYFNFPSFSLLFHLIDSELQVNIWGIFSFQIFTSSNHISKTIWHSQCYYRWLNTMSKVKILMIQLIIMVLIPIIERNAVLLDQVSFPSSKICRIEQVDESSTFKNKTNCPRCFTHHVNIHCFHLFIIS